MPLTHRFVISDRVHRGAPDLTPEHGAERMAATGAWMEKVGEALVDAGSPFALATVVLACRTSPLVSRRPERATEQKRLRVVTASATRSSRRFSPRANC